MRLLGAVMIVACAARTEPPFDENCGHEGTPIFVGSSVFGPMTGSSVDVPITPTIAGELLVVTIVTPQLLFTHPTMIGGESAWQVGLPGDGRCGKYAMVWTLGNIEPGVSNVHIDAMTMSTTYAVSVSTFTGLRVDSGTRATSNYGFGEEALPACPGALLISAAMCGAPSLPADSAFREIDIVDGVKTAYSVPTKAGTYTSDWLGDDTLATAIFEVH